MLSISFALASLLAADAAGADGAKFEWEASPQTDVVLSDHRYALVTVTNVEDRDICRSANTWPGAEGRLTDDDFLVTGAKDPHWSYTGLVVYPSRAALRLKPGATIKTTIDLPRYYKSSAVDDHIVAVEWLHSGFVYCRSGASPTRARHFDVGFFLWLVKS